MLFTLGVLRPAWLALMTLCLLEVGMAFVPMAPHVVPKSPVTSSQRSGLQNPRPVRASTLFNVRAAAQDRPTFEVTEANDGNLKSSFASARRIVAVGDVHGGSKNLLRCLRSAGIADEEGNWCGDDSVLVQVGDILDRGTDEAGCVEALIRLREQSRRVGGNVIVLLGNHEVLNADQDFRYAASGQFSHWKAEGGILSWMSDMWQGKRSRLFQRGGGPMSLFLSTCPVVVKIGDTVFCHGGLTRATITHGFQELNDDTSAWLQGRSEHKPSILEPVDPQMLEASPLWERAFGTMRIAKGDLARLDWMLERVDATKMVIGHTPQIAGVNGVETREGNQVWRIDVGLGDRYGKIECLEMLQSPEGATECMTVLGEDACEDGLGRLRVNRHARKDGSQRPSGGIPV